MFYLHPWEIDPDQPRFAVGAADRAAPLPRPRPDARSAAAAARATSDSTPVAAVLDLARDRSVGADGLTCARSSWRRMPPVDRRAPSRSCRRWRPRRRRVGRVRRRAQPTRRGYHSWAWRGVFARAFGHESIYLIARDGDRIAGVLPLVLINSLAVRPLADVAAVPELRRRRWPIAGRGRALLVAAATEVARAQRCRHVELRHVGAPVSRTSRASSTRWRCSCRSTTGMWDGSIARSATRFGRRRSPGLTVERGGVELLADFYAVFARNMRDLGTPVYSTRFFEEVLRAFPERDAAFTSCG